MAGITTWWTVNRRRLEFLEFMGADTAATTEGTPLCPGTFFQSTGTPASAEGFRANPMAGCGISTPMGARPAHGLVVILGECRRALVANLRRLSRRGNQKTAGGEKMTHCQFAIYPLRTGQVDTVLEAALREVSASGLEIKVGKMSTELHGEAAQVFVALQAAYQRAATLGDVVMTVTLSNAC